MATSYKEFAKTKHYTILVFTWQPNESKIHNHPCNGCIITPLRGEMSEVIYEPVGSTDTENLIVTEVRKFKKGCGR